jgi:hypothetical protein
VSGDFHSYRAQLDRLLADAEEALSLQQLELLGVTLRGERERGARLSDSIPGLLPQGLDLADRILAQLSDADEELEPTQVGELEEFVYRRLVTL